MKILITGVAGFIGSNLADYLLRKGFTVMGIDNLSYGVIDQVPSDVTFFQRDIRDQDLHRLFDGVDCVFHLAAKNCISDCQSNPVETVSININGTINVFQACVESGVKKVIYAESSAIYEGSSLVPTPETESSPESFYAISKASTSLFAEAYQRYFPISMTGLRYFCVYGPRQDYRRTIPPVISAFIIKLLNHQQPVIYGTGKKRRDFVYIEDVNDFHFLALNDERTNGKIYNIGSGINYSVREIFDSIESILQTGIEPLHQENLPAEAEVTLADVSMAEALGWKAKFDLERGLRNSIDYINKNLF